MSGRPAEVHVTIDDVVVAGLSRAEALTAVAELRSSLTAMLATPATAAARPVLVPAVRVDAVPGARGAPLGRAAASGITRAVRGEGAA